MTIYGTRVRNGITESGALNNTRRPYNKYRGDVGGFTIDATDISFDSTNTITSAGATFPAFYGDVNVNGDFADYIVNGTFAADTDWTKGAGWTIGAGVATAAGGISTALSQTISTLVTGRTYTLTFTATRSAGSVTASVGGTSGTARSSSATFTESFVAGSGGVLAFTGTGFTGTIDNAILTAWEFGAGWANTGGVATATTSNAAVSQSALGALVQGEPYVVTYTVTRSAGTITPSIGGTAGTARSTSATFTEVIIAGATQVMEFTGVGFSGTVDTVDIQRASLDAGQLIQVIGSPLNSRLFEIVSVTPSVITVNPALVSTEIAGAPIQIRTV